MKKLLLPLLLSLLPLTSMAVGVQSTGTDSTVWGSNVDNTVTAPLSLQNNPGNIFASITFDLRLYADDRVIQTVRPISAILIPEGSNDSVFFSTTFLRLDAVVDGNLVYETLSDASAQGAWLNDAADGTDNYLGVQFIDVMSSDNYKWFAATIKTDPRRQLPTGVHVQGEESLFFA